MASQSFYPIEGTVEMWAAIGLMLAVSVERKRALERAGLVHARGVDVVADEAGRRSRRVQGRRIPRRSGHHPRLKIPGSSPPSTPVHGRASGGSRRRCPARRRRPFGSGSGAAARDDKDAHSADFKASGIDPLDPRGVPALAGAYFCVEDLPELPPARGAERPRRVIVLTSATEEVPSLGEKKNEAPLRTEFLIVEAAKAGTTSLYHYLGQHPDVFMPHDKEPWYFCNLKEPAQQREEMISVLPRAVCRGRRP